MKKQYIVLKPVVLGGITADAGSEVELDEEYATNLGDLVKEKEVKPESTSASDQENGATGSGSDAGTGNETPVVKKYKVVAEFTTPAVEASEGVEAKPEVTFEEGSELEMAETDAAPLVAEGVIEEITDENKGE